MFLTPDGEFDPLPSIAFDAKGRPSLDGRLLIPLEPSRLAKAKHAPQDSMVVLGRSGHAQVGLELTRDVGAELIFQDNRLSVPITIRALGAVRELWLDTILDLLSKGRRVKAGRILDLEGSVPLGKADVEALFSDDLIAIEGDYAINDDGSVRVFLDPSLFVHDLLEFSNESVREQILVHSRMALQKYQDQTARSSLELKAQALAVTGIRFSTGPFPALIRPELGRGIRHIRSGVFLDGFRSTRIGRQYGASGVRQIELFNDSDTDRLLGRDSYVDIDILPALDPRNPLGIFSRRNSRSFYHRHGVPLAGVIDLATASVQAALFDKVPQAPAPSTYYGRIITPNGVTSIPWAVTAKFQHAKLEKGIESVLGTRDLVPEMLEISAALRMTVDHGRVFVSHSLPAADDLFWLRELGISAFIFKDVARREPGANGFSNVFMSGHLHETIHKLALQGVAFSQVLESTDQNGGRADVREFFKGFWCLDEAKIRSEKVSTLINMYGWHKSHLLVHSEAEIEAMFRRIGALVGMEKIGVMHGKGPGFMLLADEVARKIGMLSVGVGLDVEKVGQHPNFLPDLTLDFVSYERAYRQKLMDQLGLIKIFNLGGYGTLEELAITLCSYKLFESVPAPLILVDESVTKQLSGGGELGENFWSPLRSQVETISRVSQVKYHSDEVADLTLSPFGLPWMMNLMHCVPTYMMAAEIIERFVRDPIAYWKAAGLSDYELGMALKSYRARLDYYGFAFPEFLSAVSHGA